MKTDKELLEIYMWGFTDELDRIVSAKHNDELHQIAYDLGREDALIGDDVSSSDLQTNEEVLNKIKIKMNDNKLKEFLDWLTDETTFNIQKDEINEIIQDWNYYKANYSKN